MRRGTYMRIGLCFGEVPLRNYIVRTLIGIWKQAAPETLLSMHAREHIYMEDNLGPSALQSAINIPKWP